MRMHRHITYKYTISYIKFKYNYYILDLSISIYKRIKLQKIL
jgi:hypothetical protein